eukprot:10699981-Alexandrium_andersonii.AAC.1
MRRLGPEIMHSARKCCTCASSAVSRRTVLVHARVPHQNRCAQRPVLAVSGGVRAPQHRRWPS